MRTLRSAAATAGVLALATVLSGCGAGKDGGTPTRGQVLAGGQPAAGAQVTLVPLDGKDEPAARPSATVGADGTFALGTYDPATRTTRAGAPPGKYAVLVTWFPPAGLGSVGAAGPKPDRLGGRYKDAATSPFRVEVKDTPTDLNPIQVADAPARTSFGR